MDKKHMESHLNDEALGAVSGGNDSSFSDLMILCDQPKKTKTTPTPPTPEPIISPPEPVILPVKFESTEPVEYKRTEPSPATSGLPSIYYKRGN